jgi:hypothetical protein
MNLILVCMVCQCNVYVIPESTRRKDLGIKWWIHHRERGMHCHAVTQYYIFLYNADQMHSSLHTMWMNSEAIDLKL